MFAYDTIRLRIRCLTVLADGSPLCYLAFSTVNAASSVILDVDIAVINGHVKMLSIPIVSDEPILMAGIGVDVQRR